MTYLRCNVFTYIFSFFVAIKKNNSILLRTIYWDTNQLITVCLLKISVCRYTRSCENISIASMHEREVILCIVLDPPMVEHNRSISFAMKTAGTCYQGNIPNVDMVKWNIIPSKKHDWYKCSRILNQLPLTLYT